MSETIKRDIINCAVSVIVKNSSHNKFWTNDIIDTVCNEFAVTKNQITGSSHKREIVYARFAAMYLIRKYRGYSLPRIGRIFGSKDHSTVWHALNRVAELRVTNSDFYDALNRAENEFILCEDTIQWPPVEEVA